MDAKWDKNARAYADCKTCEGRGSIEGILELQGYCHVCLERRIKALEKLARDVIEVAPETESSHPMAFSLWALGVKARRLLGIEE